MFLSQTIFLLNKRSSLKPISAPMRLIDQSKRFKPKGVANRNEALEWIIKRVEGSILQKIFFAELQLYYYFLNGPTPASFCLFFFFSHTNFTEKNSRLQLDLNFDRWSWRQAHWQLDHHHHGPQLYIFVQIYWFVSTFTTTLRAFYLGSPMLMDPHLSQKHVGLKHTVLQPQQEVTRCKV